MTLSAHTTQPALFDVLALFPKCTRCGEAVSQLDAVERDPMHTNRARHTWCSPQFTEEQSS